MLVNSSYNYTDKLIKVILTIRKKGENTFITRSIKSFAKCLRVGNEENIVVKPVIKIRVPVINSCYRDLHDACCGV